MNKLSAVLVCLVVSVPSLADAPDYETGDVDARVISGPDEDGDLQVSIKVVVTNYSDKQVTVLLSIQGLDDEEYEVFEGDLQGKVNAKSSKAITDTYYISPKVFESISRWSIED